MNRLLLSFIFLVFLVSFAGRLIPHAPNFTPVGAFALFTGAYLVSKYRWTFLFPAALMFFSDIFIGFYDVKLMAVVYGSFLAYVFIGLLVSKKKNPATILLGSIGGAVLFYLSTNFAVWAFSPWYSKTLEGLMLSYTLALPFFRATLLGDMAFTALFFGAYEFARAFVFSPATAKSGV